jgi:hypothetical protein
MFVGMGKERVEVSKKKEEVKVRVEKRDCVRLVEVFLIRKRGI